MITVSRFRKTCDSCPAQWEGVTDDGRFVYIRYRYGCLTVGVEDTMQAAIMSDNVLNRDFYNEDGGDMSTDELRGYLAGLVVFPDVEDPTFPRYRRSA